LIFLRVQQMRQFLFLSERYRYPKNRYAATINTVAGLLNIQAGFQTQNGQKALPPGHRDGPFATDSSGLNLINTTSNKLGLNP